METLLEIKGLRKSYGRVQALAGIDMRVGKGEVVGLLGANGAGKTTFTKCVTGFVRPDAGTVRIAGHDPVTDPGSANRRIGLVPDQFDFYGNMTGRQHLDFYGRLQGLAAGEREDRIRKVLERVRAHAFADRKTRGYSHGMKQRICIAQAILHDPDLLLFDEPTNGLDPRGAYELRELIKGLAREGHSIVLNSHLLHEVEETCERVVILNAGTIVREGRVADLRNAAGAQAQIRVLNPNDRALAAAKSALGAPIRAHKDTLRFAADPERLAAVVAALAGAGARIVHVELEDVALEQVFLQSVGGAA